jgi:FKBP-type peptidyl-prolyl cis-trans isomerase FkpA
MKGLLFRVRRIYVLRRSLLALMLAVAVTGCGGSDDNPNGPSTPPPQGPANLVIEDLVVGTGAEATGGRQLTLVYNLYLYDPAGSGGRGQQLAGPEQYPFRQGTNATIPGFEQGTHGMLVGGVRRITIPPSLAYGAGGRPPTIPGNAWLVFDVQLNAVAD